MNIPLPLLPHHRQIAFVTLLAIIAKEYFCGPYKDAGYSGASIEVAVPAQAWVVGCKIFSSVHQVAPSVEYVEVKNGFDIAIGTDGEKEVVVSSALQGGNDVRKKDGKVSGSSDFNLLLQDTAILQYHGEQQHSFGIRGNGGLQGRFQAVICKY